MWSPLRKGNLGEVPVFMVITAVCLMKLMSNLSAISSTFSLNWGPLVYSLFMSLCVIVQFIPRPLVTAILFFSDRHCRGGALAPPEAILFLFIDIGVLGIILI